MIQWYRENTEKKIIEKCFNEIKRGAKLSKSAIIVRQKVIISLKFIAYRAFIAKLA
jgi:hypothetical protein